MSSVNELVKESILAFPFIHSARSTALRYILCSVDSDYAWDENGEVVYNGEPLELWSPELEVIRNRERDEIAFSAATPEILVTFKESDEEIMAHCSRVVSEISSRMFWMEPFKVVYPPAADSLVMNIPDNATTEWKVACHEMRIMTQTDY